MNIFLMKILNLKIKMEEKSINKKNLEFNETQENTINNSNFQTLIQKKEKMKKNEEKSYKTLDNNNHINQNDNIEDMDSLPITINKEQLYQTFILFHKFITYNMNKSKNIDNHNNNHNQSKVNSENINKHNNRNINISVFDNNKDSFDNIPIKTNNNNFAELLEKKLAQEDENKLHNKNEKTNKKIKNESNKENSKSQNVTNNKLNISYDFLPKKNNTLFDNNLNVSYKSDTCLNFYNYNLENNFSEINEENKEKSKDNNYSFSYKKSNNNNKEFTLSNNNTNRNRNYTNSNINNNNTNENETLKTNNKKLIINVSQDLCHSKSDITQKDDKIDNNFNKNTNEFHKKITEKRIKLKINSDKNFYKENRDHYINNKTFNNIYFDNSKDFNNSNYHHIYTNTYYPNTEINCNKNEFESYFNQNKNELPIKKFIIKPNNSSKEMIISQKIQELNKEIIKFKEEKSKIIKLKNEYEKIQSKLMIDLYQFNQRKEEFEKYREEELLKIRNDKKYILSENKNISAVKIQNQSLNIKLKKEKEKIEKLEQKIIDLQLVLKQRDNELKEIKNKYNNLYLNKNSDNILSYKISKNKKRSISLSNTKTNSSLYLFNNKNKLCQKRNNKAISNNFNIRKSTKALSNKVKHTEDFNNLSMNENKMLYLTNSSYYRSNLYKAQNLSLGSQSKTIKNNKNNKRIRYDLKKEDLSQDNIIKKPNIIRKNITQITKNNTIFKKNIINDENINNTNKLNNNKEDEIYDFNIDKKYLDNNSKIINTICSEGKIINIYNNNKKEIIFESGVKKEIFNDGHQIIYFANGDLKQVYPDGKIVYFFNEAKTVQTTLSNGTQIFKFKDGQIEKHFPEGNKEIKFKDGTKKYIFCNGCEVTYYSDGTIQRMNPNKIVSIEKANEIRSNHFIKYNKW